ncbi:MAG: DUF1295 domain-containing protein [Geminicoccaceae bacterium]|nr:DUF1295 domain-containing protein [Geminicoccaceae bacterium]
MSELSLTLEEPRGDEGRVAKAAPVRPQSSVSVATGLVGAAAVSLMVLLLATLDLSLEAKIFACFAAAALPMMLWSILVEKVHLRPSTGLAAVRQRDYAASLRNAGTKLLGLAVTFGLIAVFYWSFRFYASGDQAMYFGFLQEALPYLFLIALPYLFAVDLYMVEPEDGLWHMGRAVMGRWGEVDGAKLRDHFRAWTIKAFFLAFLAPIVAGSVANATGLFTNHPFDTVVSTVIWLVQVMFFYDVIFGTIGYILTFRPLDSHIRSANPHLAAWVAALSCYPPFILMGTGGPLDYRMNTQEWMVWFQGHDAVLLAWGSGLVLLTAVYAWATVIFGMRFSNLTHRGILTNGPYRFFKHPAYVSKNLFWWGVHMPFIAVTTSLDAWQNVLLILVTNLVYYLRAKTEERHLRADPVYRQYEAWIAQNGIVAPITGPLDRALSRLFGLGPRQV